MILVHETNFVPLHETQKHTNVEAKGRANEQGVAAATCNPAVDRQPDLRRPGLAEQHR